MSKITIITTCLNAASFLGQCISSVASQSYEKKEHILIDGGSTDGTLDMIGEHRSHFSAVISEPDRGIYDGMNKGLRLATGDIIGILNADDLYAYDRVLADVAQMFGKTGADSCYADLVYVTPRNPNKVIRYWHSGRYNYKRFYWGWMPPHPTFFVKREIYKKYGYFNLALGSAADYELMLRFLVRHKISTTYIPKVLVKMRAGGTSNASLRNRLRAHRNDRLAWKVNGLKPYPWTLLLKPLRKIPQFLPIWRHVTLHASLSSPE